MTHATRVGILGHWGGNIGHEIMSLGVETVLQATFGDRVKSVPIEQHSPFDIYPAWNLLRHLAPVRHGRNGAFVRAVRDFLNRRDVSSWLWRFSWVSNLDLGIACGGPLITRHLAYGDLDLMFHHMHGAFASHGVPVLNLSVGSCYPWEHQPKAILEKENVEFLRRVFEYSTVTTVRDELAKRLCAGLDEPCELVVDTGFAAGKAIAQLAPGPAEPHYVVINYQKYGANEDWGQNVDAAAWRETVQTLVLKLGRRYQVVFLCHNEAELLLAEQLNESTPRCQPKTMKEYAEFVSGAIAGITNRIHAGVALAGTGSPVVGVGTDTRLGTLEVMGLPCFYVKQATVELLEDSLEQLIACRTAERERLMAVQEKAINRYIEIIKGSVTL